MIALSKQRGPATSDCQGAVLAITHTFARIEEGPRVAATATGSGMQCQWTCVDGLMDSDGDCQIDGDKVIR